MKNILILSLIVAIVGGCGSIKKLHTSDKGNDKEVVISDLSEQKNMDQSVPDWYLNPPKTDGKKFFATSSGYSRQMQLALDKAVLNAKYVLASQINSYISGTTKALVLEEVNREVGDERNYAKSVKRELINDVRLKGFQVEKAKIKSNSGAFRAFVLLSIPVGKEIPGNTAKKTIRPEDQRKIDNEFDKLEEEIRIQTFPVE